MRMTRFAAVLAMTASAAALVAACGAAKPRAIPVTVTASPTSSPSQTPADPPPTPAQPPTHVVAGPRLSQAQVAAMTQARESVSDAAIMRQLADSAERIARQMAAGSPPPRPASIDPGSNRALGYALMIQFGWPASEWPALDALWNRESGWNQYADNVTSHAYGIPQSLPATKMAVVGPDWQTNASTQIRWGLAYIGQRYGSPSAAWAHEEQAGWY